ncbi:MAG: prolyl oligopeptidase family serine peptidase [Anaeromyxobacter sp.]
MLAPALLAPALLALALLAPAPLPLETLFARPAVGELALSPTGRYLAATFPGKDGRLELKVADLDVEPWTFRGVAYLSDLDIAGLAWVNDRRLVFRALDPQGGGARRLKGLWAIDADGENGRLLIDSKLPRRYGNVVVDKNLEVLGSEWELEKVLAGDGDEVLLREWHWSSLRGVATFALARVDTRAKHPKPLRLGSGAPEFVQRWITDARGNPRWLVAWSGAREVVHGRGEDGGWEEVASFKELDPGAWSPRFLVNDTLFVATVPPGGATAVLAPLDPETRRPAPRAVLTGAGFDVGELAAPIVDEETGKFLGWRTLLDGWTTRWIDEDMERLQGGIDRALPGRTNLVECRRCETAKRWLVTSSSDRAPPAYHVFEPDTGRLRSLGGALPDVAPDRVGPRALERFLARDGLEIPVYVTRPPPGAAPPGPRPAVVYVHAGPAARVSLAWPDPPVPQALAARGYVVLEPEFRGSTGYGPRLAAAGRRQWGLAVEDDLADAVRWAAGKGLVDPARVCVMGLGYGGYAALMAPVRAPGAFRCAIAGAAPTDLEQLWKDVQAEEAYEDQARRTLLRELGPATDEERLEAGSPVNRAAELAVPVLAAWGKDDLRVPVVHGRRFRAAAEKAKLPLEYVEYAGEGHAWLERGTWLDFMKRTERLLARTIGPDVPAPKAKQP